jgi:hypothetical protein
MKYVKLPETEAAMFVRALGLLVNQAGIYGPMHNVTQLATRSVFAELEKVLRIYGPVEIVLKEAHMLVNGSGDGITAEVAKNLAQRMLFHKISGILFAPPANLREFSECIALFGTPAHLLATEGGFEEVLKKRALQSVRVVSVAYQRVVADTKEQPQPPAPVKPLAASPSPQKPVQRRAPAMSRMSAAELNAINEASQARIRASAEARKQRAAALAAMLRSAAESLEKGADQDVSLSNQSVSGVLDQIRDALSDMSVGSHRDISTLAREVEEDSKTIDSIESAARRRGVGLILTRGELVQRYAELNQEIAQPLTVSTGVIGLLSSGKVGDLSESQRDLLKLAAESVERVNQLVSYMNRISGLPDTYTPDKTIIADSYRQ